MLLAGFIVQITNEILDFKSYDELTTIILKMELASFEFADSELQNAIQEFQQKVSLSNFTALKAVKAVLFKKENFFLN